jgi:hypothetical protein
VIVEVIAPAPTVLEITEPDPNQVEVSYVRGLKGDQGEEGIQGATGATGATGSTGATGAQGSSGVVSVTAPITNTGTSSAAVLGIDQTGLTLAQSQITGLVTALGAKAALTASQTFTGTQSILTGAIGNTGLVVRAAAGQTSNLILGQDSNGTSIFRVRENGRVAVGTSVFTAGFSVDLTNIGAAQIGAVIRGAASQSANFFEIQNSAASVITRVDSGGILWNDGGFRLAGSNFSTAAVNGGAYVQLYKATAVQAPVTAGYGRLFFLNGTNANTLKLVVVAGNGAAQTIMDNIPQ